jgi:hypothetical protein
MSATEAVTRPAPARVRPARRPVTPGLRLVAAPAPRSSVVGNRAFALLIVGLIVGGMALLLVINTTLAEGAFQIQALQKKQQAQLVAQQALMLYVARNEAPDALAAQAARYGMVPVAAPAFLRLSDGAILGRPTPAVARVAGPPAAPAAKASTHAYVLNMAASPDTATASPNRTGTDAATSSHGTKASTTTTTNRPHTTATPPATNGAHR